MRNRSSIGPSGGPDGYHGETDALQVVTRRCTLCDWEAQVIERGLGEDPLCPRCYGRTERAVVGVVVSDHPGGNARHTMAASLGRLGGLKGGPARAQKLSAKRRREIASKAARARWEKKKKR